MKLDMSTSVDINAMPVFLLGMPSQRDSRWVLKIFLSVDRLTSLSVYCPVAVPITHH